MAVQNQLPDRQGFVAPGQSLVRAGESLLERDEIVEALAHFLAVDGDHVVVEPVSDELHPVCRLGLGDFAFVVGKFVLQPAAVDVDGRAEILHAHRRAFQMPAGVAHPPGAGPLHDVVGLGFFPQRKIDGILLVRRNLDARSRLHFLDVSARELAILGEFRDVEVHRAVNLVGIFLFHECFHQLYLLDYVAARARADVGSDAVEPVHVLEEAASIDLGQRHRMRFLLLCLLGDLILAFVRIVGEMPDVGNILNVCDGVSQIAKVPDENVEADVAFGMSQMRVPIDGRPADVYPHPALLQRLKFLFSSRQTVIKLQSHFNLLQC